ncbi:probable terpene synthase 6 [Jatropha curcas]|uniref:probable terpene synthase 6 n=1 Tax=Jatropha curcas TaxID=180498 RepID=UPI0018933CD2|nr:probable terpene synthase 6 [Jatropha curcas]
MQTHLQPKLEQNVCRCVPNFPPTLWGYDSFASFSFSDSEYESYTKKVESLKENVRDMLMASTENLIQNIELIDTLCRLSVSYHFEMEIEEQLNHIFYAVSKFLNDNDSDLYSTGLLFRVLRQHGYKISCNVFNKFKDKDGNFQKAISNDVKGILSLYEASFVKFPEAYPRGNISCNCIKLPDYMKDTLQHLFGSFEANLDLFEETSNIVCKEGRSYCAYYTKEAFKELLRAYRMEAKWSNDGYVPTFGEYLHNGATSSSYGVVPAVCFVGMGKFAGIKEYEWLKANPKIANAVKIIGRLLNDIVSHEDEQKRGDCASSVECYKNEYGVTEDIAVEEILKICGNAWKDINEECMRPNSTPRPILECLVNIARITEVAYTFDDGYTNPSSLKDKVISLFLEPLALSK